MTDTARISLRHTLSELIRVHGPWVVLFHATDVLRPAFEALEAAESAHKSKQPRKPKPKPPT